MADIQDGTQEVEVPCPACDKPNRAGHKFCRHCGASMAVVATPPSAECGSDCGKCGTVNKTAAKFCRVCGEPLELAIVPEREPEPEPRPAPPPEPEMKDSAQPERALTPDWVFSPLRRKAKATLAGYLIVGGIGLLVIIGGGIALRSAMAGNDAKTEVAATVEAAPSQMASEALTSAPIESAPSVLQGAYSAHLADQDITLTIVGPPSSLAQLGAIMTYSNVVSGGGCGSTLEPEAGRSSATESAAPLKFQQVPVAGQQACPRAIPVSLDISGQTVSADGVVQSVQATWLNPDTGEVLMSGLLVRSATQ